ncbi:E3 ubiquitin-protein ligase HERC2, partial [Pseudolycoriella hygida]
AQYIPLPSSYSEGLKSLISQLLKVEPNQRPSATEVLQYWIPLVYRNLGKNKGYEFKPIDSFSESCRSVLFADTSTKDFLNKQYMEASTATISGPRIERSVLYQLSAFGSNTILNPLQLPSNIKIHCVATNGSHFLVVTAGGQVYSWGEGSSGQLGYGNIGLWKHYPTCIDSLKKYKIISACAGEGFSVFLSDLGVVFTVGDNSKCSLGHNDVKNYLNCWPIDRLNDVNIILIACGTHHVVAVSRENNVFSWGTCKYGGLGLGKQICSSFPTRIHSPLFGTKIIKIACAQNCTLLLLENGEVLASGRNNDNKLGLGENVLQSMFFVGNVCSFECSSGLTTVVFQKHITDIDRKVLDISVSSNHSIFLIEGGYVLTTGKNNYGQRGLGHCNVISVPTLVTGIKDKYIKRVQCSLTYCVVFSDDNVITLWGTRTGLPDKSEDSSRNDTRKGSEKGNGFELGNSTAAFTNFLASVYKSELVLDPIDILAVFSSEEQIAKGYYIKIADIFPLHHSILVLVDTTTPLATNNV